tara:strand:- start:200 stop:397 length:198 start_codon:yes stop_codon:yes gene_type:complete
LDVQLILLKVAEVVEEEIVLALTPLKDLETQEDLEEVAHLMNVLLEELVLETLPLQLPLKVIMEE